MLLGQPWIQSSSLSVWGCILCSVSAGFLLLCHDLLLPLLVKSQQPETMMSSTITQNILQSFKAFIQLSLKLLTTWLCAKWHSFSIHITKMGSRMWWDSLTASLAQLMDSMFCVHYQNYLCFGYIWGYVINCWWKCLRILWHPECIIFLCEKCIFHKWHSSLAGNVQLITLSLFISLCPHPLSREGLFIFKEVILLSLV